MRDWNELFDADVLEEGKRYYRQGKAKNLVEDQDGFKVRVRGSRNYKVCISVHLDDHAETNIISHMDCDCMVGSVGGICKHMAAALYLIDEGYFINASDELYNDIYKGNNIGFSQHTDDSGNKDGKGLKGDVYIENRRRMLTELEQLQKARQNELININDGGVQDKSTEEIRYFQYDNYIKELGVNKSLMNKAERCLNQHIVDHIENEIFYSDYELKGNIKLYGHTSGCVDLYQNCEIIYDKTGVVSAYCGNYDCRWNHKTDNRSRIGYIPCEHVTALVLKAIDWLKDKNPGDDTNLAGIKLITKSVGESRVNERSEKLKDNIDVHIEPHVKVTEDNYPYLSFRIGTTRLYKLKNINDFIQKSSRCEEMQLGKNMSVFLSEDCFDEESVKWYRYIRMVVEEEYQQRHRYKKGNRAYNYIAYIPELSDEVPLYGAYLDSFYDTMGSQSVSFEFAGSGRKKDEWYLTTMKGHIKAEYSVNKYVNERTNEFLGVRLTGEMPSMINGQNYSYYLDNRHIYRIDSDYARQLELLTGISEDGRIDAVVGRKHLADFYYKTLPHLRQYVTINEYDQELINSYLPPRPEFIVYFDIEDEMILCRAEVSYGGKVHSLYEHLEKGSGFENYRDIDAEGNVMQCILKYIRQYDKDVPILFADRSEETIFRLLTVGFAELMRLAEIRVTDRFRRLKIRNSVRVNVGVSVKSNILDLSIHSDEFSDEELLDILESYRAKKRYYRLKNGDFIDLEDNDSVEQLSDMMETLRLPLKQFVSGKMQLPAYRALYMDKMLEETEGIYAERDKVFKRLIKEFKAVEDSEYELPETLKKVLRKYQKTGYRWMRTLADYGFGGILADEMGLGKTLQTIAVLLADKWEHKEEHHTSLVICPASLVYNWKEELMRYAPELNSTLVVGTKAERNKIIENLSGADVVVTSYDLLKRDIDCYEGMNFRFEIIDEAQNIKNQTTAAAKAVKIINAAVRFALTGTPIENRLSELWSIFDYLMPGFLYDYKTFKGNYETPITKNGDENVKDRLSKMVSPFILRRKKKDVLKDLPDKLEEIRYAGMDTEQRQIYDGRVVKLRRLLEDQSDEEYNRNKIQVLSELTRIRQVCCDPSLVYDDYNGGSAKRDSLMELVDGIVEGGHKALIFSQFTSMFELIEKELQDKGIIYYKITGQTPKEKRLELVNAFNGNDVQLFLISLKAGGTGLNLTGADIVVHYDPWWNVAAENQATDRAHRIGQSKVVTVYKLILKDTIEERIIEMQKAKLKLAEDILDNEAVGSTAIDRKELLKLLE